MGMGMGVKRAGTRATLSADPLLRPSDEQAEHDSMTPTANSIASPVRGGMTMEKE